MRFACIRPFDEVSIGLPGEAIVVIALHRYTERPGAILIIASEFVFQIPIKGFDELVDDL
jgi:hypothetical protein